jgi:hypothetical protein
MPTRPRGTSGRGSKTPPPFAGSALEDESSTKRSADNDGGANQRRKSGSTQMTGGSLERREIPSFSDDRAQRIAERAYWRAERRGFEPGRELDDWLEAEREVDAQRNDPSRDQRPDGRTG